MPIKFFISSLLFFLIYHSPAFAVSEETCSEFFEAFSGQSINAWEYSNGNWLIQNEQLQVKEIEASMLAFAETQFSPAGFFHLDVDIERLSFPEGSAIGILPFTTGEFWLDVGSRNLDGLGTILFADGDAHLIGYDVAVGEWYMSPPFTVTEPVTSIGVSYKADSVHLRINKKETGFSLSGDFTSAPSLLDTLWLVGQNSESHLVFDNICAGAAGFELTVQKSGSGSGNVSSVPAGINCGEECTADFVADTQVVLTATPDSGSVFTGWLGGSCSGTGSCTLAMDQDLSITAGFDLEPVIPLDTNKTKLYFPYFQGSAGRFTSFAVSNNSAQKTHLEFRAYGTNGQLLDFANNPSKYDLKAHEQLAKLGHEVFGINGSQMQSGWVELTSDHSDIGSFFQVGGSNWLDGSVSFSEESDRLFFTRIFEGSAAFRGQDAETFLSIANPGNKSATLELNLYSTEAKSRKLSKKTRILPANGFLHGSISEIFGETDISSGFVDVRVTSGTGIVGFALIYLESSGTCIGLNAALPNNGTALYSAQLASLSSFFTDIKLVNTNSTSVDVTLIPIDNDGSRLAEPVTRTLAAGEILEEDARDLFGWGSGEQIGSLQVLSASSGIVGDIIFGDPTNTSYAAALPLQTRLFTEGVFSQVANGLGYFTGLAFFNPGTESSQITIEAYTAKGIQSDKNTLTLEPGKRISRLLNEKELLSQTNGQIGGFVNVSSSQPLIAQQLFGSAALLSAVPPTVSKRSVAGPQGVLIDLADQSERGGSAVTLISTDSSNIVASGERSVSPVIEIDISGPETMTGDGFFKVTIPITAAEFEPDQLIGKTKVKGGEIFPVYGFYDADNQEYELELAALEEGWIIGVVESDLFEVIEADGSQLRNWLTPTDWKTCEYKAIRHRTQTDPAVAENVVKDVIIPAMEAICTELSGAGFRSPRLWIDVRHDPDARIVHIHPVGGSYFSVPWVFKGEQVDREEGDLNEDQMHKLGQVHVGYAQFQDLKNRFGIEMKNILIHEMFHSVQSGYDIRTNWKRLKRGDDTRWSDSLKAFKEGTATTIGQTYQEYGTITGPDVAVRRLHEAKERAVLNYPIDNYLATETIESGGKEYDRTDWYTKQDFFAWLAKEYKNGSYAYLHLLFERLGYETHGKFGLSHDKYALIYRQAADAYFRANFPDGFSKLYEKFKIALK